MNTLQAMQAFTRVVELESFTKAAESLGLPKASISNAVNQLESHMQVRLLYRTTRKLQLTTDGALYYERCKDLLSDFDDVESMFQKSETSLTGKIRVDLPSRLAKDVVIPRLNELLKDHPQLDIELSSTDRRVDVVREGFDCVLRVGNLSDSGLIARSLGSLKIVNCASAAYIKHYGKPKTLEDLEHHRLIHYATTLGAKPDGFEYMAGSLCENIKMKGSITVNNSDAYLAACLSGLGIAQIPLIGVIEPLAKGTLIEVLPAFQAESMPVSILYPHRRNLARRVQVFIDWLEKELLAHIKDQRY